MKEKRYRKYYGHGKGPRNTEWRKARAVEQYLVRIFGKNMWHGYYMPKEFSTNSPCYCCGIKNAEKRIWVNVWGICFSLDVCKEHAKFHGKNLDDMPSCLPLFDGGYSG